MKINIGENLKRLRLSKDLTQEQLAEVFGVSPQAISRWENNTAYPDITMLPGIAVFYETTIDDIIGMDDIRKTENLNTIHNDVNTLIAGNQVDKAIDLLQDGLKLYPNNGGLLLRLAETYAYKSDDISQVQKGISLFERALQNNDTNMKDKSTATVHLIFLYLKLNNLERANSLIKSLPHIWESREALMPEVYDGNKYRAELKSSLIKALIYFNEKIQSISKRKFGEVPDYFQLGIDFEPKISVTEMLGIISEFLDGTA